MKILLLTVGGNYHAPVLFRNIRTRLAADEIRVIVSSRSGQLTPRQILQRYGWKYTYCKLLERLTFTWLVRRERRRKLGFDQRRFLLLSEVVEAFGIASYVTADVNAPECVQWVQNFRPDMIISVYFDQILKRPLLQETPTPPLNLHPSLLPAYAGSSPTFWVMANGETQSGITIHEMTEQVDRGRIIYQEAIPIEPDDTQFSLYRRCTLRYLEPLLACIDACRFGNAMPRRTANEDVKPSYYSKVTKADIDRFLARGWRFIRGSVE